MSIQDLAKRIYEYIIYLHSTTRLRTIEIVDFKKAFENVSHEVVLET